MDPVTYPLPVPRNTEELERNLQIIERDLSLTREQITADAQRLQRGEPLPDAYTKSDRGYLYTLLTLNVGFGDEEAIWAEKSQIAADNLAHYLESGELTAKKLTAYVQAVMQSWQQRQNFKDPYAQTELAPTMSFLRGALWTALEMNDGGDLLKTMPMVCQLLEAGQATPLDVVQLVYDTLVSDSEDGAEA